jgi:uncharacterized protein
MAPGRFAHASGALWLPAVETALVADLHLGYAWAQRRRGELGPVIEGGVAGKLRTLIDELHPACVAIIGDLVHAPQPHPDERGHIERVIRDLAESTRLVLVPGNHDRRFVEDFPDLPLEVVEEWTGADVVAVHGHRKVPRRRHLVIGHLHPAISIRDDAGASQKIPVFVAGTHGTVLPAFSTFTRGTHLSRCLTPELCELLGGEMRLFAATGRRVVPLSGWE